MGSRAVLAALAGSATGPHAMISSDEAGGLQGAGPSESSRPPRARTRSAERRRKEAEKAEKAQRRITKNALPSPAHAFQSARQPLLVGQPCWTTFLQVGACCKGRISLGAGPPQITLLSLRQSQFCRHGVARHAHGAPPKGTSGGGSSPKCL